MSTNGMTSWAVDLAEVGAVYPFQGYEFLMFLIGVIFWLWWHVVQMRMEASEVEHELDMDDKPAQRTIENY